MEINKSLIEKAQANLDCLLMEYRTAKDEGVSEKYLEEMREEIETANRILSFIINNS